MRCQSHELVIAGQNNSVKYTCKRHEDTDIAHTKQS